MSSYLGMIVGSSLFGQIDVLTDLKKQKHLNETHKRSMEFIYDRNITLDQLIDTVSLR